MGLKKEKKKGRKWAIFCSSSLTYGDYAFIEEKLSKKMEDFGLVLSNGSGKRLVELFCQEKHVPNLINPISKENPVHKNVSFIVSHCDVCIFFSGESTNSLEIVKKQCEKLNKPFHVIVVKDVKK